MFNKSLALIFIAISASYALAGCSTDTETTSAASQATTAEATLQTATEATTNSTSSAPIQEIDSLSMKAEYDSEEKRIYITVENNTGTDLITPHSTYKYYKVNDNNTEFLGQSNTVYSTVARIMPVGEEKIYETGFDTDALDNADFSKDKFIVQAEFDYYENVEIVEAEDGLLLPNIDDDGNFSTVTLTGEITLK